MKSNSECIYCSFQLAACWQEGASKQAKACWIPLCTGAFPWADAQWSVEVTSVTLPPSSAWQCSQISIQLNSKQKRNSRRGLGYSLCACFLVTSQLSQYSRDICDFVHWLMYPLSFWKSMWWFENTELETGDYGYQGQYLLGRAQVIPHPQQAPSPPALVSATADIQFWMEENLLADPSSCTQRHLQAALAGNVLSQPKQGTTIPCWGKQRSYQNNDFGRHPEGHER